MASITQPKAGVKPKERARAIDNGRLRRVLTYVVLIIVCLIIIFPLYWMVTISIKTSRDIYRTPSLLPDFHRTTLDNFRMLLGKKHFLVNIRNSVIVATSSTVISVVISALTASCASSTAGRG
jgi:multiple sugar transport system permease protein